uniref:Glycosyltransferase subfamily 4-like N-terminal domain-containing protein n=1 Tax=Rhizochromulina marina TaxID=1034831 RepID=A0A7S2RLM0_9STRA|mmetsp:Transcript_18095/g.52860  ORF Transcript_18095/g.52860 Transcript_18095/m.52860 type:complete len:495 (+) Transcript_18095:127-1611(+)
MQGDTPRNNSAWPIVEPECDRTGDGQGMNVLLYSHSLPPWVDGVSTRFRAHIKMLEERGHQVDLLTIEPELEPSVRKCAHSTEVLTSRCLYWYPAKRFPDLTVANLAKVWRACRQSQADVMHVTMCPAMPLFYICTAILDIPLMVSIHTDSVTLLNKCKQPWWVVQIVKALEPLGSWVCDAAYTVSPSYSAILLQRGIKCMDVTWGGYANPDVFRPERRFEGHWRERLTFGHPEGFIICYAGRISPEKDIDFLVELTRQFKDRGVWLALIGDGPAAEDFVHLHGEEHQVYFVPKFLGQNELAQVYASVDVVTSASTFETFGYTALEAMQCGTPFLGPRAQGFRDVVSHGKGGYLFDARDLSSAAHYLELLLNERTELFPRDGVVAAVADFTALNCLKRTLVAYERVKAKRHATKQSLDPVTRVLVRTLRIFSALVMVVFMAINWILLSAPYSYVAVCDLAARARRTAGGMWDRRMRFTNLTRNRVLVGSQVVNS